MAHGDAPNGRQQKGMSALQLQRMLGVTYKTAWFLAHRIREAMKPTTPPSMGGEGKIIEVDETEIGGKARNRRYGAIPKKHIVLSLVERGGGARSAHVASVSPKSLRPTIVKAASRKSRLMTDDAKWYVRIGEEFAGHQSTEHAKGEYVRGDVHTNTVEGFSQSSSGASSARITTFPKPTLTVISQNLISATQPAPSSA